MNYFWETVETIKEGVGFNYFDSLHLTWILCFIFFTSVVSMIYRKSDTSKRDKIRKIFALFIILDEIFKQYGLISHGNWIVDYLPLHLCSINIFIIAYHVFKPNKTIDNFLYAICIPGALAAILAPTWVELPLFNFMHIHSFTVHILLAAYPIVLVAGGDIVPDIKLVPKAIIFTCILALPIFVVNLLLDTNFMFLMYASAGNPLLLFEELFGFHLLGVPVIESAVVFVLYAPFYIYRAIKEKNTQRLSY